MVTYCPNQDTIGPYWLFREAASVYFKAKWMFETSSKIHHRIFANHRHPPSPGLVCLVPL